MVLHDLQPLPPRRFEDETGATWRVSLLVALLLGIVAVLMTADARRYPHTPYDPWLLRAIQSVDLPGLTLVLWPVDTLTSTAGAVLMWAVCLGAFAGRRRWREATVLLLLPAAGFGDNLLGEITTSRVRPTTVDALRVAGGTDPTSFPSGHVLGAVLLYGFLYTVAGAITAPIGRRAVRAVCIGVIVGTGLARIWLGAHWPSDVLASYVVGGLLVVALVALYRWLRADGPARLPLGWVTRRVGLPNCGYGRGGGMDAGATGSASGLSARG